LIKWITLSFLKYGKRFYYELGQVGAKTEAFAQIHYFIALPKSLVKADARNSFAVGFSRSAAS